MIDVLARLEMVLVDREQQGTGVQNAMQLHPVSRTRSNFPHRSTILYSSYQSRGGRERRTLIRVVLGLAARRVARMQILPPIWRPLPGLRLDLRRLNAAEWKAVARHAVGGVKLGANRRSKLMNGAKCAEKEFLNCVYQTFRTNVKLNSIHHLSSWIVSI